MGGMEGEGEDKLQRPQVLTLAGWALPNTELPNDANATAAAPVTLPPAGGSQYRSTGDSIKCQ